MKLEDYRYELGKLKSGEAVGSAESISIIAGAMAHQLRTALWQPWCKGEAAELAAEFRRIADALGDAAIAWVNRPGAPVGTVAELIAAHEQGVPR